MRWMFQAGAFLLFTGLVVVVVGCGDPKNEKLPETGANLEGTVTYNGKKVMAALIIVQTPKGASQGEIDENGVYHVQNVPVGDVNIGVNTTAGKGMMRGKIMAKTAGKQADVKIPEMIDIPPKYFDPTTSGIKTTTNPGDNKYDIVIK